MKYLPLTLALLGQGCDESAAPETSAPFDPFAPQVCALSKEELKDLVNRAAADRVRDCWGDIEEEIRQLGLKREPKEVRGAYYDMKEDCPLAERPMIDANELVDLLRGGVFKKVADEREGDQRGIKYVLTLSNDRYLTLTFRTSSPGVVTDAGTREVLSVVYTRSNGAPLEELNQQNTLWGQVVDFYIYGKSLGKIECDQWGCSGEFNVLEEERRWNAWGLEKGDREDFTVYQVMNLNVLPTLKELLKAEVAPGTVQFNIPAAPVELIPQYDPKGQCEDPMSQCETE